MSGDDSSAGPASGEAHPIPAGLDGVLPFTGGVPGLDHRVPARAARETPARAARETPARAARETPARAARAGRIAAAESPLARVVLDVALPHLDRPFDYLVPEDLATQAIPGVRVRVRFAGRLVDGFIVERLTVTEHGGRLAFLERVVSAEIVLTPDVLALARAVAGRWAGDLADVLRLAVPPRHARVEGEADPGATELADGRRRAAATPVDTGPSPLQASTSAGWSRYRSGARFVAALRAGRSPRAVWAAAPGGDWPAEIAELVAATVAGGRGALVVVPDGRDAARVGAAVAAQLGDAALVVLTADLGPAERYRRFLAVCRGQVQVVVGTRAAAFAPVADLGLVVVWDDGDDLHAEPRAPYPHVREVVLLRAHLGQAAAVVGGHAVTAEGARLIATGWAKPLAPERATLREIGPTVGVGDDPAAARAPAAGARLPSLAWQAAHDSLDAGLPVLVQVPRAGYLPALSCDRCRSPLRCPACAGPLAATASAPAPACRWCGRLAAGWQCPHCASRRYRSVVVGARRTAEELGRAFPGVTVRTSTGGDVLDQLPSGRSLVIATPGAEPVVAGGYGAALLLDGWVLLGRADLRAGEEALRRWLNAAALVRPGSAGGRVVVVADSALAPVQALVRWDPFGHAEREFAERVAVGFPPAVVFAELLGDPAAVDELLADAALPPGAEVLGPVPVARRSADGGDAVRALVRATRSASGELAAALHEGQAARSARKRMPVRVRIDPVDLG